MLTASHLAYRYDRRRWGLHDGHFSVAGPAVGVLGPNGAGKSTLLSLVTAARVPTAGSLQVDGLDLADPAKRKDLRSRLGFVPQSLAVYPRYTVVEFLSYVGWLRKVPPAQLPAAIEDSLAATDLGDLRDRRIRTLSGGMRQRVVLAQALVNRPSLVVLDEPTVGLDPEQRAQFLDRVRALRDRCAVVLATHLVEDVAAVCDEVVVLAEGRTVFSGSTRELVGADDVDGAGVQAGYLRVLTDSRAAR